jgi:Protein of unknown function (DUF1592)/Protein of unknown function (DUF1588)/Protein of unknown function (DUF1587)/Protein of unknown function (DUF1585)/Protein of unknown function (DUF1595)/Planctomycete cytochrome C
MTLRSLQSVLLSLLMGGSVSADDKAFQSFLENHCASCHNKDEKKGNLDFAALPTDFSNKANFNRWVKVHDRVKAGEMPPKKHLEATETAPALEWLAAGLIKAEQTRAVDGRASYRRLTRNEYEFTIRELFSLPGMPVKDELPADGSMYGFNKVSEALDTSHVHMARYMDAAKHVLEQAVAPWPKEPKPFKKRIYLAEAGDIDTGLFEGDCVLLKDKKRDPSFPLVDKRLPVEKFQYYSDTITRTNHTVVGVFRQNDGDFNPIFLQFNTVLAGRYRFRVSVWSFWWDQGEVKPSKKTQVASLTTSRGECRYFDAPSLESKVHEFEVWLEPGDTMKFNIPSIEIVHVFGLPERAKKYQGPGIAMDWMDVEGPLYDSWPPPSHVLLFGNLPIERMAKDKDKKGLPAPARAKLVQRSHYPTIRDHELIEGVWTVNPAEPLAEATTLLKQFLPKAFRRPAPDALTARYVKIVEEQLQAGACFEEAMRAAYRVALCSPEFLFHIEPSGRLDDWSVASRLSYFLWNSPPDEILLDLAARGELKKGGDELKKQVRRMLADPRADRFIEDFLGQWLSLNEIAATSPDKGLYPEFYPYMQDCMVGETQAFFKRLISYNLGIKFLVDSDFAMLNGQLGKLYGIADAPDGHQHCNVQLPPDSHRGGLLTQASILKITANGTTTSPVKRGVWVMDRLLGKRPDPPPPSVTGLEPDVRGSTTIREQLALHRNNATCATCHRFIDPPGFALESYDVIGQWRDRYRAKDKGEQTKTKHGEGHYPDGYKLGLPVDCSGEMADGTAFKNVDDMKQLLLKDERQLARNYLQRLIIYATGKEAGFSDRQAVEKILDKCGNVNKSELTNFGAYRMRSLIEELVLSDLFLSK